MVDGLEQTGVTAQAEPEQDRALGRQVGRQESAGSAAAQDIEGRIQDLPGGPALGVLERGARAGVDRSEPIRYRPNRSRYASRRSDSAAGWLGSNRASRSGFSTLLESCHRRPLNHVQDGLSERWEIVSGLFGGYFSTRLPCNLQWIDWRYSLRDLTRVIC